MADANWSKYSSLFRFIGPNGGTSFPDFIGGVPISNIGSPTITTSVADPFGNTTGVLNLPGSSYIKSTSNYPALSGDFSIGGRFRTTYIGNQVVFSVGNFSTDSSVNCLYARYRNSTGKLDVVAGSTVLFSVTTPSVNTWAEIEISRQSGTMKGLLNGVGFGTASNSASFGVGGLCIGDRLGATGTAFVGQSCDFYVAIGSVVHWDDYTPATSRIAASYLSGTVKDSTGAYAAKKVKAYRRSTGNLAANEVISNATTGVFSIDVPTQDAHTVVFIDTNATPENALVLDNIIPV